MKILINGDNTIVFLIKNLVGKVDFENEKEVRLFLKNIVIRLKKYEIYLNGYYNVIIHVDNNYGIIIELLKENIEYFDYGDDEIDINLKVKYEKFLYELYDFNFLNKGFYYYKVKDKIYLRVDNISTIDLGKILEYSKIIFGKKAMDIIEGGKLKEMI